MLSGVLRWCYRLLMLPWSEWRKARIDVDAQVSIHQRRARTGAEVEKLRVSLASLRRMHQEAAMALDRHPGSAAVIVDVLRHQEMALRRAAADHVDARRDGERGRLIAVTACQRRSPRSPRPVLGSVLRNDRLPNVSNGSTSMLRHDYGDGFFVVCKLVAAAYSWDRSKPTSVSGAICLKAVYIRLTRWRPLNSPGRLRSV